MYKNREKNQCTLTKISLSNTQYKFYSHFDALINTTKDLSKIQALLESLYYTSNINKTLYNIGPLKRMHHKITDTPLTCE